MTKKIHPCPQFVAAQLKSWRRRRAITQVELSKYSQVKLRHLQSIEAGQVDMKLSTLGALAQGLDVSPHILLTPLIENRESMCKKCRTSLPRA